MKKLFNKLIGGRIVTGALCVAALTAAVKPQPAQAGTVGDRVVITSSSSVVNWTNTLGHLKINRLAIESAELTTDTVTVQRVIIGNDVTGSAYQRTQAMGTAVCVGGETNTAALQYPWLRLRDVLRTDGNGTSNYVLIIEGEVQKH